MSGPENPAPARTCILAGILAVVLAFGGIALWAGLVPIRAAVIVPAVVADRGPPVPVQHVQGGRLAHVFVREGQLVAAGADLAVLDTADLQAERRAIRRQRHEIALRRMTLSALRDGRTRPGAASCPRGDADDADWAVARCHAALSLLRAWHAAQQARLDRIEADRLLAAGRSDGLVRERAAAAARMAIAAEEWARLEPLAGGGQMPMSRLTAVARDLAEARLAVARLETALGEARATLATLQRSRAQTLAEARAEAEIDLARIEAEDLELTARLGLLDRRIAAARLVAPVAGQLAGTVPGPGQVLDPGETAFTIIPDAGALLFRAHVPPDQMSRVRIGQQVRLKLAAKGGADPELAGTVEGWSATALRDDRTGEVLYEVTIRAAQPLGFPHPLLPAMSAEAFLLGEPRTPMSYAGRVLADYFARALRAG